MKGQFFRVRAPYAPGGIFVMHLHLWIFSVDSPSEKERSALHRRSIFSVIWNCYFIYLSSFFSTEHQQHFWWSWTRSTSTVSPVQVSTISLHSRWYSSPRSLHPVFETRSDAKAEIFLWNVRCLSLHRGGCFWIHDKHTNNPWYSRTTVFTHWTW